MSKVKELQEQLLCSIGDYKFCGTKYTLDTYVVKILNSLIAAARQEGADRERLRILMERDHFPQGANERVFLIPVCAFSPPAFLPTTYGDALPIKEPPCNG